MDSIPPLRISDSTCSQPIHLVKTRFEITVSHVNLTSTPETSNGTPHVTLRGIYAIRLQCWSAERNDIPGGVMQRRGDYEPSFLLSVSLAQPRYARNSNSQDWGKDRSFLGAEWLMRSWELAVTCEVQGFYGGIHERQRTIIGVGDGWRVSWMVEGGAVTLIRSEMSWSLSAHLQLDVQPLVGLQGRKAGESASCWHWDGWGRLHRQVLQIESTMLMLHERFQELEKSQSNALSRLIKS